MPHSKLFSLAAILSIGVASTLRAASIDAKMNALLGSPLVKGASISLDIVEVGAAPVEVYAHNPTLPLGPASNTKLLTTAAAFEKYGAKATFKTYLYQVGDDLVLVGGGDPGLGDSKINDASPSDSPVTLNEAEKITAPFDQFAEQLKKSHVDRYRDLIVDDRVFDQQWTHPNWPADQRLDWYSAPIGGLNFNANCLDWMPTVQGKSVGVTMIPKNSYVDITIRAARGPGPVSLIRPTDSNRFEMRGSVPKSATDPYSVPIYDPGLWTGTVLHDVLGTAAIQGSGQVRRVNPEEHFASGTLLATHETPLLSVLARANKNSLNMMAECLCKRLGHDATGKPGSWENGTVAVTAYATSVGVDSNWVSLDDGSGLSNKNRVAAKAFTTVLSHVALSQNGNLFVDSLAVPGEDGTLKRRFKGMAVAGHIHAKTGHITGVSTLSGYVEVPRKDGTTRLFAFSILCNKYQGNVNPWQDQVCEALYTWATGQ